jgi:hypothetical protein
MSDEFQEIWKEVGVATLKELFWHLPGGSKKDHKKPQNSFVFWLEFESGTLRVCQRHYCLGQLSLVISQL